MTRVLVVLADRVDGRPPVVYYTSIPMISDRQQRRFESSRLKEMRKKLDSEALSRDEVNQLAQELMDDCPEVRHIKPKGAESC